MCPPVAPGVVDAGAVVPEVLEAVADTVVAVTVAAGSDIAS